MRMRFVGNLVSAAVVALALAGPVRGQQAQDQVRAQSPQGGQPQAGPPTATDLAPEEISDNFAFERDKAMRMTVPVSIDGMGPYRFLVDTGAERTVISRELARQLSLGAGQSVLMHSMTGVGQVDTVVIPSLQVSARTTKDINAPALARRHLGAEGMLGVDSLKSQRVLFDFKKGTMTIGPTRRDEESYGKDTIVVKGRSLFGRLILADARADGQKVWVIIDTGSQATIGNEALRRKLTRKRKLAPTVPVQLIGVTGGTAMADYTKINGMVIGGVTLTDMPIAFADVHPFKKLGLTDRPAILLGMDTLQVFEKVTVDFANRKVRFVMPDQSSRATESRMAGLAPARGPVR